jgi:zinc D-Ala-D-Ala carboxypeptidase
MEEKPMNIYPWMPLIIVAVLILLIIYLRTEIKDGYNENGEFDAEPPSDPPYSTKGDILEPANTGTHPVPATSSDNNGEWIIPNGFSGSPTYKEKPIALRYFKIGEFDSHHKGDYEVGSGVLMKIAFLERLDRARFLAGIPFKINSGYRNYTHNRLAKGVLDSAHLEGWAADISAPTEEMKTKILKALYEVGFRRFGVGGGFIHVDCDPTKNDIAIWRYSKSQKIVYNPLQNEPKWSGKIGLA